MLAHCRNTNYLGETFVYYSFAAVADNFISYMIILFVYIVIFIPNMLVKDYRLSKKVGF